MPNVTLIDGREVDSASPEWREECLQRHRHVDTLLRLHSRQEMAYTRLLRLYYRKEAPIPADIAHACRLVRARTKAERRAVETVLREFFELFIRADGIRNSFTPTGSVLDEPLQRLN